MMMKFDIYISSCSQTVYLLLFKRAKSFFIAHFLLKKVVVYVKYILHENVFLIVFSS